VLLVEVYQSSQGERRQMNIEQLWDFFKFVFSRRISQIDDWQKKTEKIPGIVSLSLRRISHEFARN
jgi:hypothetical protein